MKTHEEIDRRSLMLAKAIASRVDANPALVAKARSLCDRWYSLNPQDTVKEWIRILHRPWPEIRKVLLENSEKGRRLRQSNPFCGILTPRERWKQYREFFENEKTGS
ncbi:hypothetical protein L0222_26450 [bacterium]|nr:hypothetical protein [bacterium]